MSEPTRTDEILSIRVLRDLDEGVATYRLQVWETLEVHPDGATAKCQVDETINLNPKAVLR